MVALANKMDRYNEWLTDNSVARDGKPFALHLFGRDDVLYISRPEHFEEVLKTQSGNFIKGDSVREMFDDLLGEDAVLINGERWQFHRKTLVNLISTRALRDHMTSIIQDKVTELLQVLQQTVNTDQPFDIYKLLQKLTLDIFAEIGFGCKLDLLTSEEEHSFGVAFDNANRLSSERLAKPTWLWKFQRFFNLRNERLLRDNINEMDKFIVDIIMEAMQKTQSGKDQTAPKNIMTILLKTNKDITPKESQSTSKRELRAEIHKALPGFRTSDSYTPSYEEIQGLQYLEATIREVLRLSPTVPVVPYHCAIDTVLDGIFIPAGTDVFLHLYATGRLTSVWGGDATSFVPERFLDNETGKLLQDPPANYSPFSAGPRICIGRNLAMLEMKMTVAAIVSQFKLTEVPGQDVRPILDLTLIMKNSLLVRATAIV
ncbi:hypothetical protein V7S43_007220 [Phytophthora oleae]|uniref:Cytochrome P450 n=1 Tax=Phytophthora oleae TaxID=2107226 RepID=A0ABD3FL86_9STRA